MRARCLQHARSAAIRARCLQQHARRAGLRSGLKPGVAPAHAGVAENAHLFVKGPRAARQAAVAHGLLAVDAHE